MLQVILKKSRLVLKGYMTRFLKERNETIKAVAESEDWKRLLAT